ncbi:hypothetical protein AAG570_009539 [Ranatra chinensis]|uniref:Uncharacterized protein n=1 Tax=Ranatra chinensis TaxID=642074 RepID=A0ABD0ZAH0_9HEMI
MRVRGDKELWEGAGVEWHVGRGLVAEVVEGRGLGWRGTGSLYAPLSALPVGLPSAPVYPADICRFSQLNALNLNFLLSFSVIPKEEKAFPSTRVHLEFKSSRLDREEDWFFHGHVWAYPYGLTPTFKPQLGLFRQELLEKVYLPSAELSWSYFTLVFSVVTAVARTTIRTVPLKMAIDRNRLAPSKSEQETTNPVCTNYVVSVQQISIDSGAEISTYHEIESKAIDPRYEKQPQDNDLITRGPSLR